MDFFEEEKTELILEVGNLSKVASKVTSCCLFHSMSKVMTDCGLLCGPMEV